MDTQSHLEEILDTEKIPYKCFEIAHEGELHYLDTQEIRGYILDSPPQEQEQIADRLETIGNTKSLIAYFEELANQFVKIHY